MFDYADHPEPKIELINGRLIIGNSLRGSRYVLWDLLAHLSPDAALGMASESLWWEALSAAYRRRDPPPHPADAVTDDARIATWRSWATNIENPPAPESAGPMGSPPHRIAVHNLAFGLFGASRRANIGLSLSRDCVVRLGENAFTPDVFLITPDQLDHSFEYYFEGPPALVIEVALRGHEAQDRDVKRRTYEAAGVPEYWIVDPERREVDFLHLTSDGYRSAAVGDDGRYRPWTVPELTLIVECIWDDDTVPETFEVTSMARPAPTQRIKSGEDLGWGSLPFEPRPDIDPAAVSFEEFTAWSPEAKFERDADGPIIAGREGTRNVLGMLLRNFGLREAVGLLPPVHWVEALARARDARLREAEHREAWWQRARQAAAILRESCAPERLAVVGALASGKPLGWWDEIELLGLGLASEEIWQGWKALRERFEGRPRIHLVDPKHLDAEKLAELEATAVNI